MSHSHEQREHESTSDTHASEAPPAAPADGNVGDEVLGLIADVEDRLTRLREHSRQTTGAVESLHRRQEDLGRREDEINRRTGELESLAADLKRRENELNEWTSTIDGERRAFAEDRERLDQERGELEAQRRQIEEARAECEQMRSEIAREREQIDEQARAIALQREQLQQESQAVADAQRAQSAELKAQLEQLKSELSASESRAAAAQSEYEQACLRSDSLTADLESGEQQRQALQDSLEQKDRAIRARDEQLAQAKNKLIQFAETLDSQREQIDAAAAAQAELQERDREIQRFRETVERLEGQANELRAAAAAKGGDAADIAKRDEEIAKLHEQNATLEDELKAARAQISSGGGGEADSAELAERERAIDELTRHIRRLQTELEQVKSAAAAASSTSGGNTEALAKSQTKVKELERRLAEQAGRKGGSSKNEAFVSTRKQRLHQYKDVLFARAEKIERARNTVRERAERLKSLESERQHLLEAKQSLERAEKKMIRRWARSRAVSQLFLIVMGAIALGAASYFGVMTFWPSRYSAAATVEAKARPGFPLTSEQVNAWQTVHEQMVHSDTVINVVADRLRQRGFQDLAEPAALAAYLNENLSYESTKKGELTFNLVGVGQADTHRILDTYSVAFVSVSNELRSQRTDGGGCNLVVPAMVDTTPVEDKRPQYAAMVFGGSIVTSMLLGGVLCGRLRRVQRVLEEDADLFEPLASDERWEEIRNAGQSREHVIDG